MDDSFSDNALAPDALMMLLAILCRDTAHLRDRVEELERRLDAIAANGTKDR